MRAIRWLLIAALAFALVFPPGLVLYAAYRFFEGKLANCPGQFSDTCSSSLHYAALIFCITIAGLFLATLLSLYFIAVLYRLRTW